jgi:hypothetical protein
MKKAENSSTTWKSNGLVHAMTEAILDSLDGLTFVTDDEYLVGATAKEILQELPKGATLSEVEEQLNGLRSLGLVGTDQCGCEGCDSRFYFRICGRGVPLVLHSTERPLT